MQAQGNWASEVECGSVPRKSQDRSLGGCQQRACPTLPGGPAHAGMYDEGIVAI